MSELAESEVERYTDPRTFAREVNLPLLGVSTVAPVPAGASASVLLAAEDPVGLKPVVEALTQTRQSLTLRSLLLTGFPHDPEFSALGLALAREWSRLHVKVAVVDLDFRHPTIVRPRPDPNEGFVDVLEYGCSFRRVAWELVADSLWAITPGSHPPEENRFTEHPDWDRAMRVFSAQVDVTLYLAPFLDRKGFTGRISKRMDGVLLAASVERAGRTALRDAFLELWGSDAPMIGCVGIGPRRPVEQKTPEPPAAAAEPAAAAPRSIDVLLDAATSELSPQPRPAVPAPAPETARANGSTHADLVDLLSEEVGVGEGRRVARHSSSARWWVTAAGIVVAASAGLLVAAITTNRGAHRAVQETIPSGMDEVLPAELGGSGPAPLPNAEGVPHSAPEPSTPPLAQPPETRGASSEAFRPYRVHVASFKSEAKVDEIATSLRARGLDAWYEPAADLPGWYRVFVGHYVTHAEAEARASWLLDHGSVERARAYPDSVR